MTIIWNTHELRPFESPWSILEKIKLKNYISSKDLLDVYGKEQKNRNGRLSIKERDLWDFKQFDLSLLEGSLGFSIVKYNLESVYQLTKMLPKEIDRLNMFRNTLYYCPMCIENKYHSMLHQFKWIHRYFILLNFEITAQIVVELFRICCHNTNSKQVICVNVVKRSGGQMQKPK